MSHKSTYRYSGLVTQNEFQQRYQFIRSRIHNNFSRAAVAFLLGKPTYFVVDYEQMEENAKLSCEDIDLLYLIFKSHINAYLDFDTVIDRIDISNEKRALRINQRETSEKIFYELIHPWSIDSYCKPINIIEAKQDDLLIEQEVFSQTRQNVLLLINSGYLDQSKSPLEIFEMIEQKSGIQWVLLNPMILRQVIYSYIGESRLTVIKLGGRFRYQVKINR